MAAKDRLSCKLAASNAGLAPEKRAPPDRQAYATAPIAAANIFHGTLHICASDTRQHHHRVKAQSSPIAHFTKNCGEEPSPWLSFTGKV